MSENRSEKHSIEITHADKVLFSGKKLTKKDVADYYRKISDYILPYLEGRPLVLHRYPEGIEGTDFYQKDTPDYFPSWIKTIKVKGKGKEQNEQFLVNCDGLDTLLYIVNQGSITPHVWLSRQGSLNKPDRMIFDLDPPGGDFHRVQRGARDLKELLDELGLTAFLMTTGSEGVHITVPLDEKTPFDETREFASAVVQYLASKFPDRYTTEIRKNKREGRLFLDYLRNSYGQTGVAPYSLRARKGAPVATPFDWNEIVKSDMTATTYTYANIFRRLGKKKDPWKDFYRHKTGIRNAQKKLKSL